MNALLALPICHLLAHQAGPSAAVPGPANAPDPRTSERLVEALVATVNQTVITLGEVDAEARIVLVRRGGPRAIDRPIDDGLRAAVLQYLINQEVILAEARRLKLFQVTDVELAREIDRIASLFAEREQYLAFLANNGLSEDDVREIVQRDLRVGKFLRSRVRMVSRPQREEIQAYYDEHLEEWAGRSMEEVLPIIEERLGREQHDEVVRAWILKLKERAEIRLWRSFDLSPEP